MSDAASNPVNTADLKWTPWRTRSEWRRELIRSGVPDAEIDGLCDSIRDAAKAGVEMLPGVSIEGAGERRGRKYRASKGVAQLAAMWLELRAKSPKPMSAAPPSPSHSVGPISTCASSNVSVEIHYGDNAAVLPTLPRAAFDLVYIDPPFNTGRRQERRRLRTRAVETGGDRTGFAGRRYEAEEIGRSSYDDQFDDYLGFMEPRLREAIDLLKPNGSMFVHLDYREVHYVKVLLDRLMGRDCFMNEIVWAYDYGARTKKKWSAKHDSILWYVRNPKDYTFQFDEMDRIPYMAPGLVGPEKAARGKTPTDVWWHTIVPTNGKERTGYATQKPLGILRRILKVHTKRADLVLDFFAGSGTTGEAAAELGRSAVLVDSNPDAIKVMASRLRRFQPVLVGEAARFAEDVQVDAVGESDRNDAVAPEQSVLLL